MVGKQFGHCYGAWRLAVTRFGGFSDRVPRATQAPVWLGPMTFTVLQPTEFSGLFVRPGGWWELHPVGGE